MHFEASSTGRRAVCRLPFYADTTDDDEESNRGNDTNGSTEACNQSEQAKPLSKSQKKRIKRKKKGNDEGEQKVLFSLEEPVSCSYDFLTHYRPSSCRSIIRQRLSRKRRITIGPTTTVTTRPNGQRCVIAVDASNTNEKP